jgi:hypothetical protein
MPKDEPQPTEKTRTGYTVHVPKRDESFGTLKKAAKPEPAEKDLESPHDDARKLGQDNGQDRGYDFVHDVANPVRARRRLGDRIDGRLGHSAAGSNRVLNIGSAECRSL